MFYLFWALLHAILHRCRRRVSLLSFSRLHNFRLAYYDMKAICMANSSRSRLKNCSLGHLKLLVNELKCPYLFEAKKKRFNQKFPSSHSLVCCRRRSSPFFCSFILLLKCSTNLPNWSGTFFARSRCFEANVNFCNARDILAPTEVECFQNIYSVYNHSIALTKFHFNSLGARECCLCLFCSKIGLNFFSERKGESVRKLDEKFYVIWARKKTKML